MCVSSDVDAGASSIRVPHFIRYDMQALGTLVSRARQGALPELLWGQDQLTRKHVKGEVGQTTSEWRLAYPPSGLSGCLFTLAARPGASQQSGGSVRATIKRPTPPSPIFPLRAQPTQSAPTYNSRLFRADLVHLIISTTFFGTFISSTTCLPDLVAAPRHRDVPPLWTHQMKTRSQTLQKCLRTARRSSHPHPSGARANQPRLAADAGQLIQMPAH